MTYVGKGIEQATVEWVSVTAFLAKDSWEGRVTIAYGFAEGGEGFGDPREVAWKVAGKTAWEALSRTIIRLERELRQSTPEEPLELEFWETDPPMKILWPRFRTDNPAQTEEAK